MPHIEEVSFRKNSNSKRINVKLLGRNFILTGRNGSGKTRLIEKLREYCDRPNIYDENKNLYERLELIKIDLGSLGPADSSIAPEYDRGRLRLNNSFQDIKKLIEHNEEKIANGVDPYFKFFKYDFFNADASNGIISAFAADRFSKIPRAKAPFASNVSEWEVVSSDTTNGRFFSTLGDNIEQHIINLFVRRSLAITHQGDHELAGKIEAWLDNLNVQLRFLMEDDSVEIVFDAKTLTVSLSRNGVIFPFQKLSSGFSSVFSIFFAMLLSAEKIGAAPETLSGIVFIDEIDVHLHVSMQRKIFPFFVNLFPFVQFIVTTHSPFVLTSVSKAIIYDLDSDEVIDDLSLYSIESVMDGVFRVESNSFILEDKVTRLGEYLRGENIDTSILKGMVAELELVEEKLDEVATLYLNKARFELNFSNGKPQHV
jgi:hypothetical protein